MIINRKTVEDYYEDQWGSLINVKTLNLLVELTCKAYHLNQSQAMSHNIKQKPVLDLQNLGQI